MKKYIINVLTMLLTSYLSLPVAYAASDSASYDENNLCQQYYDQWLKSDDRHLGQSAGIKFLRNNCRDKIHRNPTNPIENYSNNQCCTDTQILINSYYQHLDIDTKAVPTTDGFPLAILQKEFECYRQDGEKTSTWHLLSLVTDWHETIGRYQDYKTEMSTDEKEAFRVVESVDYLAMEEIFRDYCPNIDVPDLSFTNKESPIN